MGEPFLRGTGSLPPEAESGGMGLGLFIAKTLLERTGAEVEFANGDDPDMPPRAALRCSLTGKHDGWGAFGRPSGAEVHIMGITHAEFGRHGAGRTQLRREWTLFDETAIWKQIHLATGDL